jgi:hypothetical protein
MKIHAWSIGAGIVLVAGGFVLAAKGSPHEQALNQALDSFESINKTLESIKDEESAGTAKPALKKAADSYLEARAKGDKLPPPEKEEKDRLAKIYKPKFNKAMEQMSIQIRRVELVPGGKEALKEIAPVLKKEAKK